MPPGYAPGGFDCGENELTEYLTDGSAHRDQRASYSKTYLILDQRDQTLIGYFSVLADAIKLQRKEKPDGITYSMAPAIKLGRMGIDKRFRGHGLGQGILLFVIGLARRLSREVGVRYVTLDALPRDGLVTWYEKRGFVRNEGERATRKIVREAQQRVSPDVALPHVSMRFDVLRETELPIPEVPLSD